MSNIETNSKYKPTLETLNRVVRHNIRNDMAVILGGAETLREHVDQPEEDAVDRILRKSKHVIEFTELVRDFVDSLTDPDDLDLQPIKVREYLELEVESARESYPTAQVQVLGEMPPVSVQANEMLSSVFRNLLNNAVQHNDTEMPEVTVAVEEQSDSVEVRVADNGPGVPDEQKEQIFGKGEKGLENAGTGIGLYLVKTLVKGYGGDVWVEDNDPTGAVFVVELLKVNDGT